MASPKVTSVDVDIVEMLHDQRIMDMSKKLSIDVRDAAMLTLDLADSNEEKLVLSVMGIVSMLCGAVAYSSSGVGKSYNREAAHRALGAALAIFLQVGEDDASH